MIRTLTIISLVSICQNALSQDGPFSFNNKTTIFSGNALHWDAVQDANTNLILSSWSDRYFKINGATFRQSGRLGIGISTPAGNLHVRGSSYFGNENEDSDFRISIGGSGGNYGSIGYGYKYTNTSGQHTYAVTDYASQLRFNSGGFSFYTAPSGSVGSTVNFTEVLTVQRDGNIGIGNSSPVNKLQVGANLQGWSGNDLILGNANGQLAIYNGPSQTYMYGTGNIAIRPGFGKMAIFANTDGFVGIGQDDPQKILDVKTAVNDYASIATWLGVGQWSGLHFGYKEDNVLYRKSAIVFERIDDAARGKVHILNDGTYSSSSADLADSKLTIDFDGDVGIGTTEPDAKLAVKGHIHTQEVRVDMTGAMVPDYVFEPSYNLPSLSSIESYIKENKHLPEVPSAKEMEKNGVNLGEMEMLLLKKIEELTLHMIEMKKENDEFKTKIEELQKKISK